MKKLLGIAIVALFLVSFMPNVSSIDGTIEYNATGGDTSIPIKILAIWETNGQSWLDDDTYSPGCQIDPPLVYGEYVDVWVYVAVLDLNDPHMVTDTDQIKIDLSWPDNDIPGREDLGDGSNCVDNLEPVFEATWDEYAAAHAIDGGSNWPFICYYNQAKDFEDPDGYDYIHWQYFESNVKFYKAKHQLYYHDPAGWYDVEITVQADTYDMQINYFEYVYTLSIDPDFTYVDWGAEFELNTWFAKDGNWVWNDAENPPYPTVRNVGNWDTELGCHFDSGDFQWDKVLFDLRAGDSHPDSDRYNPTYCEANFLEGMVPSSTYHPIPINNDYWLGFDTDSDDVLLKCHTIKLDFYIFIIEWNAGPGMYNFDIDLYTFDPPWQPAYGHPCPDYEPPIPD